MFQIYGAIIKNKVENIAIKKKTKEPEVVIENMNLSSLFENIIDEFPHLVSLVEKYANQDEKKILQQYNILFNIDNIQSIFNIRSLTYDKSYNTKLVCFVMKLFQLLSKDFSEDHKWLDEITSNPEKHSKNQKKIYRIYNVEDKTQYHLENREFNEKKTPYKLFKKYEEYWGNNKDELEGLTKHQLSYQKYSRLYSFAISSCNSFYDDQKIFNKFYLNKLHNKEDNAISDFFEQLNNTIAMKEQQRMKDNKQILTEKLKQDIEKIDLSSIFQIIENNIDTIEEFIIKSDDIQNSKLITQLKYTKEKYDRKDNLNILLLFIKLQEIGINHIKQNKDVNLLSDYRPTTYHETPLINYAFYDKNTLRKFFYKSYEFFKKYKDINKYYDILSSICSEIYFLKFQEKDPCVIIDLCQYGMQNIDKLNLHDLLEKTITISKIKNITQEEEKKNITQKKVINLKTDKSSNQVKKYITPKKVINLKTDKSSHKGKVINFKTDKLSNKVKILLFFVLITITYTIYPTNDKDNNQE